MERTVTIYDPDTRVFSEISESELGPEMVLANVEGHKGEVWIKRSQLKQAHYRHPPFEGAAREWIESIQEAFPEVYEKSYGFWEDGFRRDANPAKEISLWLRIAEIYRRRARGKSLEWRKDLFRLLVACSNADAARIHQVFRPTALSESETQSVVSEYYGL